jgi:hypothetical protein
VWIGVAAALAAAPPAMLRLHAAAVAQAPATPGQAPAAGAPAPQEGVVAGDPAKGASLLAEARKAVGGDDKLRAIKTVQAKGSFRRAAGNNTIEGDVEILIEPPDKMKRTDDTSQPGGGPAVTATQALNGTQTWDENTGGNGFGGFRGGFGGGGRGGFGGGGGGFGGGGGRPGGGNPGAAGAGNAGGAPGNPPAGGRGNIDPEVLRQFQLRQRQGDLARLMLVWLLRTDDPVVWIGTAESPDGKADVLEVRPTTEGAVNTRLFLDVQSHLPLMITWQNAAPFGRRGGGGPGGPGGGAGRAGGDQPAPADGQRGQGGADAPRRGGNGGQDGAAPGARRGGGGAQATQQMALSDFKTVNGIRLPHSIVRSVNGQTAEEMTFSSIKVNQNFKANTFEQKK